MMKVGLTMHGNKKALLGSVAALALSAAAAPSNAAVVSLTPGSPVGGIFNYSISAASNEQINPGDFFRIYDFSGFSTATAAPGWSVAVAGSNPTPPPNVILSHGDDPTLPNIIYTYTGSAPLVGPITVPGFIATTSLTSTTVKDFVARDTASTGPVAGSKVDSVGDITVPAPIPEPMSFSLIAIAPAAMLLRRGNRA